MFRPPGDRLFDFSEKGIPPEPSDPGTSGLFDGLDLAGDAFAAPGLIPDGLPEHSVVSDLAPGTDAQPAEDGVSFQEPSGGTDVQVSLEEPSSPAVSPPAITIPVPPPPAPSPPGAASADDLSMAPPAGPPGAAAAAGSLPPPSLASVSTSPAAGEPAASRLSEVEVRRAVVVIRALAWPGPASSVSEATWRVLLLGLLMHLYSPVGADEAQRRADFLTWLEIIDWWQDEPTTDELVSAGALETVLTRLPEDTGPSTSAADRQRDQDLADEHDAWVRATFPDGITPAEAALLQRRHAPIDSRNPAVTWPDFPDALADDWARLGGGVDGPAPTEPPVHSVIQDLIAAPAPAPAAAVGPEAAEGPAEPSETPWRDIWQEFRTYLTTPFGGGWTAAQLDDPAGAARAFAAFGRFMTWAYGEDWEQNESVTEQEGGRAAEYISAYFSSGAADESATPDAAPGSASEPSPAPASDAVPSPSPPAPTGASAPAGPRDPQQFMGVLDDEDGAPPVIPDPSAPPSDAPLVPTTPEPPAPVYPFARQPDPPAFMGVLDDEPPVGVAEEEAPGQGTSEAPPEYVVTGDTVDADATVQPDAISLAPAAVAEPSPSPSRIVVGSGVAGLLVILVAVLLLVAHPFSPASSNGSGVAGGTTPTSSAAPPSLPSTGSSGGGIPATPRPTFVQPTFVAIIIDHNLISFSEPSLNFCHKPFTVKYSFRINGIAAGTPVVIQLKGRGAPSSPQTFSAAGGVEFSVTYSVAAGPGVWSDEIVTIGGAPPPFPSGAKGSTSISC